MFPLPHVRRRPKHLSSSPLLPNNGACIIIGSIAPRTAKVPKPDSATTAEAAARKTLLPVLVTYLLARQRRLRRGVPLPPCTIPPGEEGYNNKNVVLLYCLLRKPKKDSGKTPPAVGRDEHNTYNNRTSDNGQKPAAQSTKTKTFHPSLSSTAGSKKGAMIQNSPEGVEGANFHDIQQ